MSSRVNIGRRTGLKAPKTVDIGKDGFEDLDKFWNIAEGDDKSPTRSVATTETDEDFNYDTSDSISEDDENDDDTADEAELTRSNKISKKSGSGGLPLEDSFHDTVLTESPRREPSAMKPVAEAELFGMNTMDDGYAGYNDDNDDYGGGDTFSADPIEDPPSSVKKDTSRRVSFGDDVKGDKKRKVSLKTPVSKYARSDVTTPGSEHTMAISTPGSTEFPGGRVLPDETFDDGLLNDEDDDDEEEEGETDMSGYSPEQSFLESARKKKFLLDDQTDEEDVEDGLPVRRSRRATRGVRLAFWKNERPLYKRGEFVGLEPVKPTPKKTTKPRSRLMKNSDKTGGQSSKTIGSWRKDNNNDDDINNDNDDTPAAAVRIPSNREYINRDTVLNMDIWDDFKGTPTEAHIFCSHESVYPPAKLPISELRPPGNTVGTLAAQFFMTPSCRSNDDSFISGWIAGYMELPPSGIKDEEIVGEYTQVCFVSECHSLGVELAMSDPKQEGWNNDTAQRILLKKGDCFYIPPGNYYRLENFSKDKKCVIFWTVIKPTEAVKTDTGMAEGQLMETY